MTRHWTILMSRLLWCEPFGRRCEGSSGHQLATLKVRDRMLMGARSHPSCTLLLAREARCQQGVTYARVAGNISLKFVVTTFTIRCVVTTSCSRPLIAPSHAGVCSRSRPKERSTLRAQSGSWSHSEALVMPRKSAPHKSLPRSSARSLARDTKKSCEHSHCPSSSSKG